MQKNIITLVKMQAIDDKIAVKMKLKEALPAQLQHLKDNVSEAKMAVDEADEQRKLAILEQKNRELLISENKEKSVKYESQLSSIKNNKEYKALNTEIALISVTNGNLENEIISFMEQENQNKEILAEREKYMAERVGELKAQEDILNKQIGELDGEMDVLKAERSIYAKSLPKNYFLKYKQLIINRNRKAVAFDQGGACSACGFKIRPQIIIELDKMNKLIFCENCNRFLIKNTHY
ncbi:MAG: hypothetical protein B6226_02780 [Candidatus Cloacimonetes bacterium 4572_65]|nr:MAG: hypothetical protein B6226_02780 [Candidatus Cloacimonetes bacterium 4572_65]